MSKHKILAQEVEQAIADLESASSAEVVVALAQRSGRYGDIDLLWGWLFALLALCTVIWSPWHFHPDYVLLNVVLCSTLGWLLSRNLPIFRRFLSARVRREAQVRDAAKVQFLDRGVDRTSGRTGVLVYVSNLEQRISILPDRAVEQALPAQTLEGWHTTFGQPVSQEQLMDNLPKLLRAMKEPLAACLPRCEDDVDELANHLVEVAP